MSLTHTDKGKLPCAICGTPTSAIILKRPICAHCWTTSTDPEVRLYRKSFQVVQGGLRG